MPGFVISRRAQLRSAAAAMTIAAAAVFSCGCVFDVTGLPAGPFCGDGIRQGSEVCDGMDVGTATCEPPAFLGGQIGCLPDCSDFDWSGCQPAGCGDGVVTVENGEQCDGDNLNGATCITLGYTGGTLACGANCAFDRSQCTGSSNCGNGNIDPGELCDGANVAGETCENLGLGTGTVVCRPDCSTYDTSGCQTASCGNGTTEAGEQCDGPDLAGRTCATFGFAAGGVLTCHGDCSGFDTSGCLQIDGGPCAADNECEGGICWEQSTTGWPDGYCTRDCSGGVPCPGDGVCLYVTYPPAYDDRCVDTCTTQNDCRPGYECDFKPEIQRSVCNPP